MSYDLSEIRMAPAQVFFGLGSAACYEEATPLEDEEPSQHLLQRAFSRD